MYMKGFSDAGVSNSDLSYTGMGSDSSTSVDFINPSAAIPVATSPLPGLPATIMGIPTKTVLIGGGMLLLLLYLFFDGRKGGGGKRRRR